MTHSLLTYALFNLPDESFKYRSLDKTISKLEEELAAARAAQESIINGSPAAESLNIADLTSKRKYLMVVGINTAFNSRKRRDSVRGTWMPQGVYNLAVIECSFCNISVFLL